MDKLNSLRLLERAGIWHRIHEFRAEHLSAYEVAGLLGVEPSRVYKTLVTLAGGKPVLAMLASEASLDLKALARVLGVKKASMASQAEAEALSGLLVGGIGALALQHKRWRSVLDRSSLEVPGGRILLSAGRRGINVELKVGDLVALIHPVFADIALRQGHEAGV
jgi:Cys-tRNA(Pro)/Cys-tRNA(Cys) deacylase